MCVCGSMRCGVVCCVEGTREKVARLLKMYEKSHNFHNFTSGKYVIIAIIYHLSVAMICIRIYCMWYFCFVGSLKRIVQ